MEVIVSESYAKSNNISENYNIFSDEIFDYVTEHQTPEGIMAVVNMKEENEEIDYEEPYIIIVNGVQDPGNLGNIIRIADSLNLNQIILSENTVDPFMPKVVRSTMGSIFRVNVFEKNIFNIIQKLKENNYNVFSAAVKEGAKDIYSLDFKNKKTAIIFGNESLGVEEKVLEKTDLIYIPMKGKSESLNVASAVAVISYEIYRQNI